MRIMNARTRMHLVLVVCCAEFAARFFSGQEIFRRENGRVCNVLAEPHHLLRTWCDFCLYCVSWVYKHVHCCGCVHELALMTVRVWCCAGLSTEDASRLNDFILAIEVRLLFFIVLNVCSISLVPCADVVLRFAALPGVHIQGSAQLLFRGCLCCGVCVCVCVCVLFVRVCGWHSQHRLALQRR